MSTPPVAEAPSRLVGRRCRHATCVAADAGNRLITGGAGHRQSRCRRPRRRQGRAQAVRGLSALGTQNMSHVWSGYIGIWDRYPRVHNLGPDAWTWIGCNGRGVALAVSMAAMARAVNGTPIETRWRYGLDPASVALPCRRAARRAGLSGRRCAARTCRTSSRNPFLFCKSRKLRHE